MNKRKLKRFHRDIYFPKWHEESLKTFIENIYAEGSLTFSGHAVDKILDYCGEYGKSLFRNIKDKLKGGRLNFLDIFEFYSQDESVRKACFRIVMENYPVDLVLVISSDAVVITVYVTNKGDNHSTLDGDLYERSS